MTRNFNLPPGVTLRDLDCEADNAEDFDRQYGEAIDRAYERELDRDMMRRIEGDTAMN